MPAWVGCTVGSYLPSIDDIADPKDRSMFGVIGWVDAIATVRDNKDHIRDLLLLLQGVLQGAGGGRSS